MIKKFFSNQILDSSPIYSINSAALVIAVSGIASRFLGLVRDRILASRFGAGDVLDAYYAAFRIPDLIYNLIILGALSAAFIPVFTELISTEKRDEAWKLVARLFNLAVLSILVVSAVLAIFAPQIMKVITPGFSPEKMQEAVNLTRIMFLSPLLLGLSGIVGGVLNSLKKFIIYSLAPIAYNVGIIIGATILVNYFGSIGLAWGVVLGAILHLFIQVPAFMNSGFKTNLLFERFSFDASLRKVLKLMVPRTFSIAVSQVNLLVITIFASTLAAGSLTIFNFAHNLQSFPLGVFGISFAVAALPTLSHFAASKDWKSYAESFSKTFRQILFFVVPLSVVILVLRAQIVRVVLGAGKFDWEDTVLTLETLGLFVLSLFAQSLIPLLNRSFYAVQDTKTPFVIAITSEAVNIISILLFIGKFGVAGLALAFSISSFVQMSLLLFVLRGRFAYLDDKNIISSIVKISLASFAAGIVAQLVKYSFGSFLDLSTFLAVFIQLICAGAAGALVYLLAANVFKFKEFECIKNSLKNRIFRSRKTILENPVEEEA